MKQRKWRILTIMGILGMFSFLFVVSSCSPTNPDDRVICPTPFVTKNGGKISSGQGTLEITHIEGQCALSDTQSLEVTGSIRVKSTGKTKAASVYLTLAKNKGKPPVYRKILSIASTSSAKEFSKDFKFKYQLQGQEDYPYAYGLFVGFVPHTK